MTTIRLLPIPNTREQIYTQRLPIYQVILHNDTIHFVHEVIDALVKSAPVSLQEAEQITLTAHYEGRAVVIACKQEEAEYYKERMETYQLTVTIEPA